MSYQTDLAAGFMIELYEVTLADASVVRFTSYPTNITFSSNVYTAVAGLTRTKAPRSDQFTIGNVSITFSFQSTIFDWDAVQNARLLDGANLIIRSKNFVSGTPTGGKVHFQGRFPRVKPAAPKKIVLQWMNRFDSKLFTVPRYRHGQSCDKIFTSPDCGVVIGDITISDTYDAGSTDEVLVSAGGFGGQVENYFRGGFITGTSGDEDGEIQWIKSSVGNTVTLHQALSGAPDNGDGFDIVPYCGQTHAGCDRFANTDKHWGFQYGAKEDEIYV